MKLVKRGTEKSGPPAPVSGALAPFRPMRRLQQEIDRLFEEPFGEWLTPNGPLFETWAPAVDVYEDKSNVVVKAELPGMDKSDFEVYVSGETLNITGERKLAAEEKTAETYRSERYFGRFHRRVDLPSPVTAEEIDAHYKDGILTITCPKTEAAKRKSVEVKVD